MNPIAVASPSISRDPNPQFHSGRRTGNAWPRGTGPAIVTGAPPAMRPSVTVVQLLRPQSWPYEVGRNI
jgi:hypothetical protein